MEGILDGFRLRPPFFFPLFAVYSTEMWHFSREKAVPKINLLWKGLTQGISGDRGSILMGSYNCIPISKQTKGKSNGDLRFISVHKLSGQENSTQLYHQVVAMHCLSLICSPHQCGITTPARMAAWVAGWFKAAQQFPLSWGQVLVINVPGDVLRENLCLM